jgi:sugar lactone lactonase YvrE
MGEIDRAPRRNELIRAALLALLCAALAACGQAWPAGGVGEPPARAEAGAVASPNTAAPPAADPRGAPDPLPSLKVARLATFDGAAGAFGLPIALAVDPAGHVYAADAREDRIHKYDRDGRFLLAWGGTGSDDGQFEFGSTGVCDYLAACAGTVGGGLASDDRGDVYVADWGNHRVQKFSGDGRLLARWGRVGHGPGEFFLPEGIAADGQGRVYVSDGGGRRVQRFDRDGRFLGQWEAQVDSRGRFDGSTRLAVDGLGRVRVAHGSTGRVQEFDERGRALAEWAAGSVAPSKPHGSSGAAVDRQGRLYLNASGQIRVFDADRQWLASWDRDWLDEARLLRPSALAVDADGDLYVADQEGGRIHRFRLLLPVTA